MRARFQSPTLTLRRRLPQVCQVSAQQPVQTELLMRYHQLQSRLATLKIENEEVRIYGSGQPPCSASHLPAPTSLRKDKKACLVFFSTPSAGAEGDITICSRCNYPAVILVCGSQAYICAVCAAASVVLFAQIIMMDPRKGLKTSGGANI